MFFILLLALCFGVATGFVCPVPKERDIPIISKSENERFLDLQQKYSRALERSVLNILEPIVGRGKVRVSVQLDLNLKNAKLNKYARVKYPSEESVSLQQSTLTHSSEKQIQNLIQQQHISVVVDGNTRVGDKGIYQPRTQKEMNDYRRLIQNAVGYNVSRGDTIEIQNVPFVPTKLSHNRSFILLGGFILLIIALLVVLVGVLGCFAHDERKTQQQSSLSSQDILKKIVANPSRIITVIRNWIYMPATKKNDWLPIQKVGIILLA